MADMYYNSKDQDYGAFYGAVTGQQPNQIAKDGQLPTSQTGWGQSAPSDIVRVTPEGLNVHSVNTVGIDRNGNPIGQGGGYDQVDTSSPLQYQMLADQFGLNRSTPQYVPGPIGYADNSKNQDRLGAGQPGNLFAYGAMGAGSPAQNAIAAALSGGQMGGAFTRNGWGSNGLTSFLSGDPGQTDWTVANNGLPPSLAALNEQGRAPVQNVALALAPPAPQHRNVTASDGMNATQRFISDRGGSQGLTPGQQANELNKLLGGRD